MIYTFDKNQNLIGTYDEKEELTVANLNLKINKAATLDLEFPANKENIKSLKNVVFLAVPYPNNKQKLLFLRVMTRTDKEYTIELMAKEFAYQELATSGYIEDKRFKDANAKTLVSGAVQGSGYTVSNVNVSGTAQLNFYYEDYLTAVSDVIEALGGEVIFYVTLSGNKISGRYVDYVIAQGTNTSKTFAYGSNLISVERQSDASEVYTAILPRGKGELVSAGEEDAPDGYGRRINIAEILWKKPTNPLDKPVGSLVLEDPTATAAFGQVNGTARLLLKTYEDIEDKNELINAAYRDLMQYNHPATQFTASVANIGDSALGDTIVIMHSNRSMSYRTRIFEIDYDLIEINNTIATFGDNLSKNNTSSMLTSVSRAVNNVKETANFAVASANGISKNYYGENEPANPKNGDTWFYTAGDGFGIRQYVDGQWVEYVNSKTSEQITAQVDAAISNAKEYADNLNSAQTQATNSVASDLAKKADELTKNQQAISSQATAYTDSAVADANSKAVSIGQSAAQNAQNALDTAKNDFTSSFASQASQTASMASEANSKASQYASQAKSEAVLAATSADGVVRTEFKSTTDSITDTIQQNKSDADGKISTAQTTATQALDGLATKVSQTEYNTKTGQLQTDLTTTTQTANQAKTDIVSIKQKDGEQDEKMNSIVSDVNGTKQTIIDLQTVQGKQSGDISTLQQRADGFEATVTKVNNLAVGGRNLLMGTKLFSGSGWTDKLGNPYSLIENDIQGLTAAMHQPQWSGPRYLLSFLEPQITNKSIDTNYILSAWVKNTGTNTVSVGFYANYVSQQNYKVIDVPAGSDWIRISSKPFKFVKNTDLSSGTIQFSNSTAVQGGFIKQAGLKLEVGNIATDWTPSPEDLSSATAKAQLTADQATLSINNYKTDADGRISKAQADIITNANAITQKVSQSDYNAKTGELTTSVSKAQQTADTATQTIGTYKESNDKRVAAAETNITANADAIKLTASKTELDAATGEIKSDISTLEQRADGFEADIKNSNDEIARVKLTAEGLSETINNPSTGIATRLLTAEGTITTIQDETNELTSKQTLTANGLTQEIADRKTGDSNTLQAGKDFTTSQITSYDTGMQSRLAQVSDGIMATVNASNFVVDSSFVNGTDNWNKFGEGEWKIDVNNTYYGVRFIAFNNFNHANEYVYLTSQKVYKNTIPGKKVFVSVDVNVANVDSTNNNYAEVYVIQEDSSGRQIHWNSITQQLNFSTKGWQNFREEIDIDDNTNAIYLGYQAVGNVEVYIARPYIGVTELPKNGYIAGPNSNNTTQLSLFYNYFSLGIKSNTGEIISGINGDSSGLIITGKKITVSGDTTFIGNNFMDGAIIKDASIGSAQIADASITNAKISNLDVNKLSGNISNFIQSNWNGQYGSTTIDANGMTVDTSGITTRFGSYGMTLNMTGESVGGIGVQGLTGKPSDYQGLAFWLDGNAEYMAWGARNNGATSGNPVLKLSWFRDNSVPTNAYAGFNFDDDVIFNKGINMPGASTRKIIFGTQNFLNYNYSYFGDSSGQAGWSFGGTQTYMISGTTYYNATKVIAALNGIGAAKIPTAINSDGTVKTWANVTL